MVLITFHVNSEVACYGVPRCTPITTQWLCQRCQAGVSHDQDCCLCLLRGGALKRTDGGRWAHLVCAVSIPEASLGDANAKEPIITQEITRARRKLVSVCVDIYNDLAALYVCSDVHCVPLCLRKCLYVVMVCVFSVSSPNVAQQCM